MNTTVTREHSSDAPSRELWHSVPLELAVSVFAVLLAAGLSLIGLM